MVCLNVCICSVWWQTTGLSIYLCVYCIIPPVISPPDQAGAPLREAPRARLAQEERQVARHALLCLLLIVALLAVSALQHQTTPVLIH